MITPSQFAPPDLRSAALMIQNYGNEHRLSPERLLEIFHNGIASSHPENPQADDVVTMGESK
jgi:hypothetical protein